jgi:hypothetical protein
MNLLDSAYVVRADPVLFCAYESAKSLRKIVIILAISTGYGGYGGYTPRTEGGGEMLALPPSYDSSGPPPPMMPPPLMKSKKGEIMLFASPSSKL